MRPKVCKWFFGCFLACFLCLYWLEIGFYSLHGSTKKIQSYFVYLSWMEDCHLTESIRILYMFNLWINLSIEHLRVQSSIWINFIFYIFIYRVKATNKNLKNHFFSNTRFKNQLRPKVCKWFFGLFLSCFLCLCWLKIDFYSLHKSIKKIQSYFVYLSWMKDCHLTESIRILYMFNVESLIQHIDK